MSDSQIFDIVILITSALFTGFSIVNAIFYSRLRSGNSGSITKGEATFLMFTNIVLAIISGFVFLWTIFRTLNLFHSKIHTFTNFPIVYQTPMTTPIATSITTPISRITPI